MRKSDAVKDEKGEAEGIQEPAASFHGKGHLAKLEVSHRRDRHHVLQASNTMIVLKVPEDVGEALAAIHGQRVQITLRVLPPDQQRMF